MSFLDFYLSSNWERESGKRNLGIKENGPKVTYLIFFRRGSTGESFLLSRANRLCSIFNTGLKNSGPSCLSILLSSTRSRMAMVRPLATNPAQKLFFLSFTSAEGKGAPLPFWGPSQSFGFSLFPLPVSGDRRLLSANTWSPLCDPHSFLNGHFFWRLDTVNSNTSSSNFIFLLPVGYHVTIPISFTVVTIWSRGVFFCLSCVILFAIWNILCEKVPF